MNKVCQMPNPYMKNLLKKEIGEEDVKSTEQRI